MMSLIQHHNLLALHLARKQNPHPGPGAGGGNTPHVCPGKPGGGGGGVLDTTNPNRQGAEVSPANSLVENRWRCLVSVLVPFPSSALCLSKRTPVEGSGRFGQSCKELSASMAVSPKWSGPKRWTEFRGDEFERHICLPGPLSRDLCSFAWIRVLEHSWRSVLLKKYQSLA